jgi:uncharacterized protein (DUF2147 family)
MKARTGRQWLTALLFSALASLTVGVGHAETSDVDGTWRIQDLVLNIFDCQNLVCGRIVWIKDPGRRQSQCGRTIVWGLAPVSPSEWKGGSIFDPDDGKTYNLSATRAPDGTLHARIYRGIPLLGSTKILKRVDLSSFTGLC